VQSPRRRRFKPKLCDPAVACERRRQVRDLEKLAGALGQLQTRDRELTEAREQQTATSEILRTISNSPTDIQPILDAVAESAACHEWRPTDGSRSG
jgi:hypothetical protein